jgi:hypothetical protein
MAEKAAAAGAFGPVEIITDNSRVNEDDAVLTIRTAETSGQRFYVRVKQPRGRAVLIAVHL